MKKRTAALTLVLIGPTLLAGCGSRDRDCDPNTEDCSNNRRGGYYGGGFYGGRTYGGSGAVRGRNGGSSVGESGGFGSTGRSFSGGG